VKLVWVDSNGKEGIVGLRGSTSFLGITSVIMAGLCPTNAVTLIRSVVERIPAEKFLNHLRSDSNLAQQVHQIQSRELEEQLAWMGELTCCSARSRLVSLLRRLVTFNGSTNGPRRGRLPLKRKELAEFIGVTPEHLSRLLHGIARDDRILLRDGWVVLPDPRVSA
jgi:CRP/FNR family transcriptional regulator